MWEIKFWFLIVCAVVIPICLFTTISEGLLCGLIWLLSLQRFKFPFEYINVVWSIMLLTSSIHPIFTITGFLLIMLHFYRVAHPVCWERLTVLLAQTQGAFEFGSIVYFLFTSQFWQAGMFTVLDGGVICIKSNLAIVPFQTILFAYIEPHSITEHRFHLFQECFESIFDIHRRNKQEIVLRTRILLLFMRRHLVKNANVPEMKSTPSFLPICFMCLRFFALGVGIFYLHPFYGISVFIRYSICYASYPHMHMVREISTQWQEWTDKFPAWDVYQVPSRIVLDAMTLRVRNYELLTNELKSLQFAPHPLIVIIVDYAFGFAGHFPMVDSHFMQYITQ